MISKKKNYISKKLIMKKILFTTIIFSNFIFSKKLPNYTNNELFRTAPKASKFLIIMTILLTICFYFIFNEYKGLGINEKLSEKSELLILILSLVSVIIICIGLFTVNKLAKSN